MNESRTRVVLADDDVLLRAIVPLTSTSLVMAAVPPGAWVLAQPGITSAIVGASRAEQLDESLGAINMTLDAEELEACNLAWYSLPRRSK